MYRSKKKEKIMTVFMKLCKNSGKYGVKLKRYVLSQKNWNV